VQGAGRRPVTASPGGRMAKYLDVKVICPGYANGRTEEPKA
jgi:hypothetical protein